MGPFSILLVVQLAICSYVVSRTQGHTGVTGERVLDEVTNAVGPNRQTRVSLKADQDDNLKVYLEVLQNGVRIEGPKVQRRLGPRIFRSGELDLEAILPKGQVPSIAHRSTIGGESRLHAVVSWGFNQDRLGGLSYSIYVIHEDLRTGGTAITYRGREINAELKTFLILDADSDGHLTMIDAGRSGKSGDMHVHAIGPRGEVKLLQALEGFSFSLIDGFDSSKLTVVIEDEEVHCDKCPENWRCYTTRILRWSKEKKRLVEK